MDRSSPARSETSDRPPQAVGTTGLPVVVARALELALAASWFAIAACLPLTAANSQNRPDPVPRRNDAARQLETKQDTLKQTERRMQSLQTDVQQLNAEQARVNEQLIETGRQAQSSEGRLTHIEQRLSELDAQEKLLRGSLSARHDKIAKLFSAMQRMGRNPPPVIITRREDALQMVRSAMLLARAFPELKSQADELSTQLSDLVRIVTEARTEGERLKTESVRLTEARTQLAALVENKRRSLGERQRELEDVRRSAAEIARSVTDLGDLIGKLDKAVSERTALGAYNQELRDKEALEVQHGKDVKTAAADPGVLPPAPNSPAPGALQDLALEIRKPSPPPPPAIPAATPQPPPAAALRKTDGEVQVAMNLPRALPRPTLEPQAGAASNAGRMKPAMPFHLAKAQLPLPAQGRRIQGFGEKTEFGRQSRGIVIETRHGAAVIAPSDGWVVYAGEFRSYGQVLIINAGGGYHILLANLARIDVEVGRFVLSGEPVGAMSSNAGTKTQDGAPVLYVEFRNKDGQSIDPTPWWTDGTQKVQG
jgi:murein hydrolase activator